MESGNKYVCSCTEDYEGDKCEIGIVCTLVGPVNSVEVILSRSVYLTTGGRLSPLSS